ncbi:cytochrome-c peroxidase [Ruegeria spongiae]|uniref:cytochrome-c peroxidase n=1 Tax=Ruegeria spongiae TaxID=2942209 RepID=UPI003571592F
MSIYKACKLAIAPGSTGSLIATTLTSYVIVAGASLALALLLTPGSSRAENQVLAQWPDSLRDSDFLFEGAPDEAIVELGRNLFFDPILSGNRNISCGTCHDLARGSGDGVTLSIGEGGIGFGPERRTKDGVTERTLLKQRNSQCSHSTGRVQRTGTVCLHFSRQQSASLVYSRLHRSLPHRPYRSFDV